MMPIEPSPVRKLVATSASRAISIQRLEKRLVPHVEVQRGVGHLGAELLAHVGDRVARLLLKLLERFAQPDSLAVDRDLARAGVELGLLFGQGRANPLEPLLALGARDGRRVGQERQDLGPELDQARRRGVASLDLVGVEPLDELEHAILEGGVRRGLRVGRRRARRRARGTADEQYQRTENEEVSRVACTGLRFLRLARLRPV